MTYNTSCPSVKRLMKEAKELSKPTELYHARPSDDNLFDWHFTIRGPSDSEFEGGIYHGRILLPSEYPMKPPNIIFLTENGRFEIHRKICLSISSYHPESWRPSWSIRTALLALIGFMTTPGMGAIGSLDYPKHERKLLAKRSVDFVCECCGSLKDTLLPITNASQDVIREAKERAAEMSLSVKPSGNEDMISGDVVSAPAPVEATTAPTQAPPPATDNSSSSNQAFPILDGALPNTSVTGASGFPPPFWICFPYYPMGFAMPPIVPVAASISNNQTAGPMSFEEFVRMKKESERRTQQEASGSSARANPPTSTSSQPATENPASSSLAASSETNLRPREEERIRLLARARSSRRQVRVRQQEPLNLVITRAAFYACLTLLFILIARRFLIIDFDWAEPEDFGYENHADEL